MHALILYYIEKGGIINGLIFCVCFVAVYIGTGRLLLYRRTARAIKSLKAELDSGKQPTWAGPLDRLADIVRRPRHPSSALNCAREELLRLVPHLEQGLPTLAAWISAAPLLGLLGTVAGMIKTFNIITIFGVGNPGLLSEGISVALLTTQAGLLVAFPCLLFHSYLCARRDRVLFDLFALCKDIVVYHEPGAQHA